MREDNLNDKITKMKKYILLSEKVQCAMDDQDEAKALAGITHTLKLSLMDYVRARNLRLEEEKRRKDFYSNFATKEEAEQRAEYLRKNPATKFQQRLYSGAAFGYGLLACISACFSRDVSKNLLHKRELYKKLSKKIAKSIELRKETQANIDKTIKLTSENEFKEARIIDNLRNKGVIMDDEAAYAIIKEPELLVYAIIDQMKEKYAPGMEE